MNVPNNDRNGPADVRFAAAGTGHVITRLFMCCQVPKLQTGGIFKRRIPWKCAECVRKAAV